MSSPIDISNSSAEDQPDVGSSSKEHLPLNQGTTFLQDAAEKKIKLDATVVDADSGSSSDSVSGEILDAALAIGTAGERYTVGPLIGAGATGKVFSAHDNTFDRDIAIKFFSGSATGASDGRRMARFIREARITAKLEHAHIVPLYDMGFTDRGEVYFTMRQIRGMSLGTAIGRAKIGADCPFTTQNDVVNVLLKVCDALSRAHAKGVIHQDVKPDNIMLGEFGEVVLVDWGAALLRGEHETASLTLSKEGDTTRRLAGTPAYMSPEQARGEIPEATSDIYSLGATLFHTLFHRHPLWEDHHDTFWQKKKLGLLSPLTAAETSRIPKRLLAIVMKAMAARADQRYQTAAELSADLTRYQAGLAVSAYRDSARERFARWHRQHAFMLWGSLTSLAVVVTLAGALYGERLKEIAQWGSPVISEDFANNNWQKRWVEEFPSTFTVKNEALCSLGPEASVLICKHRFFGPVAIEYDGTILPGAAAGDLSALWIDGAGEDLVAGNENHKIYPRPSYKLQLGANDNIQASIVSSPELTTFSFKPMQLQVGRTYHIRSEIDGTRLSIFLDGELVCEHHNLFPFSSGYIALYGHYPGKSFDHVRIFAKGLPDRLSPLAVGDSYARNGLWERAQEEYSSLSAARPSGPIGDEARYKLGYYQFSQGQVEQARAVWKNISNPGLLELVECHRLHQLKVDSKYTEAAQGLAALYLRCKEHAQEVRNTWAADMPDIINNGPLQACKVYLQTFERCFPHDPACEHIADNCLSKMGRWEEIIRDHPNDMTNCFDALAAVGRFDEALTRFPSYSLGVAQVLRYMGKYESSIQSYPQSSWSSIENFAHMDRIPEANAIFYTAYSELHQGHAERVANSLNWSADKAVALYQLGRLDEALTPRAEGINFVPDPNLLIMAGRDSDAIARNVMDLQVQYLAHLDLALQARKNGDLPAETKERECLTNMPFSWTWKNVWFGRFFMLPFLEALDGKRSVLDASLKDMEQRQYYFGQRAWHAARLINHHENADEFLQQPSRKEAAALMELCCGMRDELDGLSSSALQHYRSFHAIPIYRRMFETLYGDPLIEHFVDWRIATLARSSLRSD